MSKIEGSKHRVGKASSGYTHSHGKMVEIKMINDMNLFRLNTF